MRHSWITGALLACCTFVAGCDRLDMYDQPRYEALEPSDYFSDGLSSRPRVAGTIPRGGLQEDEAFYTGKLNNQLVAAIPDAAYRATYDRQPRRFAKSYAETKPPELRRALLERGQERYNIHCAVCHSRDGDGDGIVVQRGFPQPPSYHIDRLRDVPAGHLFDVITHGSGPMASYASRVDVADRWAIAAYIRALQLSRHARLEDIPIEKRAKLTAPAAQTNSRKQTETDQRGEPAP